jgi:DNA-binding GntR family transcriptional regulator
VKTKAELFMDAASLSPLRARVVRDLLHALKRDRVAKGSHLAARALAEEIGVSRSPVNHALAFLAGEGILEHDANRGYFLACDWTRLATLPSRETEGSEEDLYASIAADRIAGRLGETATEAELMRRYGAARTRLLRVLSRIRAEGWIERLVGHGWRFLPLIDTPEAYAESYAFRAIIEPAGILSPGFRIDPEGLASLRARQETIRDGGYRVMKARELFEANGEFHETIAAWSGNRYVLDALVRVDSLRRLVEYRQAAGDRLPRREQAVEHLVILDALEAGERRRAATLLRHHLEGAAETKAGAVPRRPRT